jgi:hypothetical protein
MVIESMRFALPASGIEHCSAPVSIATDLPLFVTFNTPEAADGPETNVTGPTSPAGTTVARPLHLTEPSGQ